MTGPAACACGDLADSLTVCTGRGESLPASAGALEKVGPLLRRCQGCGALFEWEDLPQMYGSGNNAEEKLVRLTPDAAAALQRLRDDRTSDGVALVNEARDHLSVPLLLEVLGPVLEACDSVRFEQMAGPLLEHVVAAGDVSEWTKPIFRLVEAQVPSRWESIGWLLDGYQGCVGLAARLRKRCEQQRGERPSWRVTRGPSPVPALIVAAAHGRTDEALTLLRLRYSREVRDVLGWTPLLAAAAGGHADTVELLLRGTPPVDVSASDAWNAVCAAALAGSAPVLRALLDRGAPAQAVYATTDLHGALRSYPIDGSIARWTAFSFAAAGGHAEAMGLLVAAGNQGEGRDAAHYLTAVLRQAGYRVQFARAAWYRENEQDERAQGQLENEVWFIDRPVTLPEESLRPIAHLPFGPHAPCDAKGLWSSPCFSFEVGDERDRFGDTSIGHFDDWREVVLLTPLLAGHLHGTAPLTLEVRQRLLVRLARRGDVDLVRLLLSDTPPPAAAVLAATELPIPKDPSARAEADARVLAVLLALLDAGGDPAAADRFGRSALHLAAASANAEAVRLLLVRGAPPDPVETLNRYTPLLFAAGNTSGGGNVRATVEALLASGANPNGVPDGRERPLSCAAREGNAEVILCLLEAGAAADVIDILGDTAPLALAKHALYPARSLSPAAHAALVALVRGGADAEQRGSGGRSALELLGDPVLGKAGQECVEALRVDIDASRGDV